MQRVALAQKALLPTRMMWYIVPAMSYLASQLLHAAVHV